MSGPRGDHEWPGREAFLAALAASGLLGREEMQALRSEPAPDARGLAQSLIAGGRLTPFQAEVLWEGRDLPLVLDRYTILEPAGREGLEELFRARHQSMGRIVLLRVYPPDDQDPDAARRFQAEAGMAARLWHPNLQAVYDLGEARGRRYVALEWLAGEDLAGVVARRGPLPAAAALAAVREAAEALRAAHAQGIAHGDLHAGRLHGLADGTVKVTGLVRAGNAQDAFDPRADIAALGRILEFLLTGRAESVSSKGGPLAQAPAALSAVCARLMSDDPAIQLATMAEVVDALQQGAERAGGPEPHRHSRWPRMGRALGIGIGVGGALACGVLGIGWAVWPERTTVQPTLLGTVPGTATGGKSADPRGNKTPSAPPSPSPSASGAVRPLFGSSGSALAATARARAYARDEQWAEAIAALSEAINLEPGNLALRRDRVDYQVRLGRWAEAANDLTEVLRRDPGRWEDRLARGRACWEAGRWDEAVADLAAVVEARPFGWSGSGTGPGAVNLVSSAPPPCLAAMTRAIEREPARWALWFLRGLTRRFMNDQDAATSDLEAATRRRPDLFDVWSALSSCWHAWGHWEQAQAFCDEIIRTAPSNHLAFFFKGNVLSASGQYESSLEAYSRAIEVGPSDYRAVGYWFMRGRSLAQLGRLDQAIAHASRAIELDPKHTSAWSDRASYHAMQEHWDDALADLQQVSKLKPDDVTVTLAHVHLLLKRGREAEARTLIAEVIAHHGPTEDQATANNLAWLGSLLPGAVGDPAALVRLAERSATTGPEQGNLLNTLGTAQYRAGRYREAVATLDRAIKAAGGEGSVYDWLILAMAHFQLDHADEAHRWLSRARTWLDDPRTTRLGPSPTARALTWDNRVELDQFRHEAETLIGPSEVPPASF
jgi:tetratricopeptide (TPR) repeat protein